MIAKGQDATNIQLGDTLAEDKFAGKTFDYCLSNPPYGVDWKASQEAVKAHVEQAGQHSRFPGGLPPISDGQMLFLQHLATKMRPMRDGGGRAGIVLNGSPLFTGAAESGPSCIRQWLLENDMVDAIVALPTNMFDNTGIATYVWVLDNNKAADRAAVVELYDAHAESEHSKIFRTDAFGYWTITVERPLLDDAGGIQRDRSGNPKPNAKLRDTENVPFTWGGNEDGADARDEVVAAYFEAEVAPHVPDAWVDSNKTKVGYEIPFTRQFYVYKPPRPLEEIDADLNKLVGEIMELLGEVER
jgi:type I restriction enzyme M protein